MIPSLLLLGTKHFNTAAKLESEPIIIFKLAEYFSDSNSWPLILRSNIQRLLVPLMIQPRQLTPIRPGDAPAVSHPADTARTPGTRSDSTSVLLM